jgi:hypothetical protein
MILLEQPPRRPGPGSENQQRTDEDQACFVFCVREIEVLEGGLDWIGGAGA